MTLGPSVELKGTDAQSQSLNYWLIGSLEPKMLTHSTVLGGIHITQSAIFISREKALSLI